MRTVSKRLRLKWAKRLIGARYFIAMTDREAVIALDAADPDTITDTVALTAQAAELEAFYDKLGELIKRHRDILREYARLQKGKNEKTTTVHKKTTNPKSGHVQASVRGTALPSKKVGQNGSTAKQSNLTARPPKAASK